MSTTGGDRGFLNDGREILPSRAQWEQLNVPYAIGFLTFWNNLTGGGDFVTDFYVWVIYVGGYHIQRTRCGTRAYNQSVTAATWQKRELNCNEL